MNKTWNPFWAEFEKLFGKLPGVIEDAVEDGIDGVTVSSVNNGKVTLWGKFESLKINGYTVRVPDYVLKGRKP